MRQAQVIASYRAQYANPIRFGTGQIVSIGKRDEQWRDFVWTTLADGNAGWAPVAWLKPLGDGRAEALRDYSAQEATVDAGDVAAYCYDYGGWCWIIRDSACFGWVPAANLEIGPDVPTPIQSVEELATDWIQYWANGGPHGGDASDPYSGAPFDLDCLREDDPEKLWATILEIQRRPEAEPHLGVLAAGPLEDLLAEHGTDFIERVEREARASPRFAFLLGGVWKFTMTDEVWTRVQAAWDRNGWDGIPRNQSTAGDDRSERRKPR